MELLFYSELGKLSVEYLQFNTINNIEYMSEFQQDKLFISIVLESDERFIERHIKRYYMRNIIINDNIYSLTINKVGVKCLKNYNINHNNEDNISNEVIMAINFICFNLTFDQIMDRNFFFDYFLSDGINIKFNQFINSSRFSFGYLLSQKIKDEPNTLKTVVTLQLNNVLYDQANNLVSITQHRSTCACKADLISIGELSQNYLIEYDCANTIEIKP